MSFLICLMLSRNNRIQECLQYFPSLCNEKNSWQDGHNAVGSMLTLVDLCENQIHKLKDLSHHPFLECLLLSKNQIKKIEGIKSLSFLQVS
jgi:Leucine-rich repeat (LRR) protein